MGGGNLTKAELAALMRGFTRAMPSGKYSRSDFQVLMDWAANARLEAELLELVLMGYLDPFVDEGVLRFMPTPKGLDSSRRNRLERLGS